MKNLNLFLIKRFFRLFISVFTFFHVSIYKTCFFAFSNNGSELTPYLRSEGNQSLLVGKFRRPRSDGAHDSSGKLKHDVIRCISELKSGRSFKNLPEKSNRMLKRSDCERKRRFSQNELSCSTFSQI